MNTRTLKVLLFGLLYVMGTWALIEVEAFEWLFEFSRDHEDWDLDEIVIGTVVGLFFLLLWFLAEVMQSRSILRQKLNELDGARQQTQTAEHLLDIAYNTSPALFTISRLSDGGFIRVNDAWTAITGYSETDIQNQSDTSLGLWQNPQEREYFILHTYAQRSLRNFEATFTTKSGTEKHMLLSGEVVEHDGEDCLLMVGMDISERLEIEQTKSQFISVVSHELRTPLTAIQGSLQLILGGTCGIVSEKATQLLQMAERNSVRLLELVNDILDLEKLRSGALVYLMDHIQLDEVIEETLQSKTPLAGHHLR